MIKGRLSHTRLAAQLILWLVLIVVCTAVAMLLWMLITGGAQDVASLKLLQLLQPIGTFVIPTLLLAYLCSAQPLRSLRLTSGARWQAWVLVPIMMLIASPGINLLSYLNQQMHLPACLAGVEAWMQQMEDAAMLTTELFVRADTVGVLFFNIFLMALMPALGEELCFRGTLQNMILRTNSQPVSSARMHMAIWLTAIVFSAVHMQFFGFIPRMLLGALLGYLVLYSGSLWLSMEAHFTNNLIAVLSYYAIDHWGVDEVLMETLGAPAEGGSTLWLGILSLVLTPLILYYLCKFLFTHEDHCTQTA